MCDFPLARFAGALLAFRRYGVKPRRRAIVDAPPLRVFQAIPDVGHARRWRAAKYLAVFARYRILRELAQREACNLACFMLE
jgi:hypothetical protein